MANPSTKPKCQDEDENEVELELQLLRRIVCCCFYDFSFFFEILFCSFYFHAPLVGFVRLMFWGPTPD